MTSNPNEIEMEYSDIPLPPHNTTTITSGVTTPREELIEINYALQNHIKEHSPSNKTGMYVSAKNLSYYVENKVKNSTEKLILLNDASFYLKPGRMTLLMGAPGSGKSVLIKTLANRWGNGKIEGSLLFNNHPLDSSTHQKDTIYVNQEDRHIALLTVRETMDFSAQCNMGENVSDQVKNERVNLILDQMGMNHTSNTIVGNEFFRGISGGQKRRVTIASEFTKCPNLILMDEPTTGLDSATSFSIISKVKTITIESKTSTLISLLQPSPELTALFDDVMIMTEHGHIAYFGPMEEILPYFKSIGISPLPDQPIAEFFQEVSEDPSKYIIQKTDEEQSVNLVQFYKNSENYRNVISTIDNLIEPNQKLVDHSNTKGIEKSSMGYEIKNLLMRQLKVMKTSRSEIYTRMAEAIFTGIVIGTLFYNLGDDQAGGDNRFGVIYVAIITQVWTCFGVITEFFSMRSVFYDQKDGKFYRNFPYFLALVLTKFPVALVESFCFSIPCYWLAGLRARADCFFLFVFGLAVTNIAAQGVYQAISSMVSTILTSILVTPAFIIMFMIFTGFMLPRGDIPGWWIWMHYLSPLKYIFEMLSTSEMYGLEFGCTEKEMIPPKSLSNFNLPYPDGFNGQQICPRQTGSDFLKIFDMRRNFWFRWIDVVIILAFLAAFFTLFYFGIRYFNFETKTPSKSIKAKKNKKQLKTKVSKSKHTMGKCYMTMKNLTYTVKAKRKNVDTGKMENVTLTLLKNVTGYIKPGLTALMGPSGAGKSTLLDVISGRKNMGTITGEVEINGIPVTKSMNLNRFTGYVEQQDILAGNLTVREAIEFSANCRLPSSVSAENRNPADFILEISENHDPSKPNPIEAYQNSENAREAMRLIESKLVVPEGLTLPKFRGAYSAPFLTQFRYLLKRSWLNHVRRPHTIYMRFFRSLIPALVVGTLFLRLGQDQSDARNKLSMIYLGFFFASMAAFGKIPLVVEDRAVYYRDANSSTYPPLLYLLSIIITDLPMNLITTFVYWVPMFFLTGLDTDGGWKFFYSLFIYLLMVIAFESISQLCAFFFPTVPIATITLGLIFNFLTQFGGFYIPKNDIPRGWIWMHYLMFTKYGFETLGLTEMQGQTFNCDNGGSFAIPVGNNQTMTYCPIQSGDDMIEKYSFETSRQYYNILILSGFILCHHTLSFLSLKYVKHMNR
eukprot:gene6122-7628_t